MQVLQEQQAPLVLLVHKELLVRQALQVQQVQQVQEDRLVL